VPFILKEIMISNFKSLRKVDVSLKKFNVLVGPNGSGKTNFIELFKFLKAALTQTQRPYMPWLEWWSFRNIIWEGKEGLPITAKLRCDIDGVEVEYEVSFSGVGGSFQILSERLLINAILTIERQGQILTVKQSKKFINNNLEEVRDVLSDVRGILHYLVASETRKKFRDSLKELKPKDLSEQRSKISDKAPNLLFLSSFRMPTSRARRPVLQTEIIGEMDKAQTKEDIVIVFLPIKKRKAKESMPLHYLLRRLQEAVSEFAILKHPNIKLAKSASLPVPAESLQEDSSNLNNVLYKWFSEKRKLPDRIETIISELFPSIQMGFEITTEGRMYLKLYEHGVELHPPCIPDGFYKVLAVLAAVELKPSVLAIDEIENSLHKEALEYLIDALRESESTIVVTTHSPLVVDMVKLEDLLILERTAEGTLMHKIKSPEKVRQKLAELKITQSESWLYGGLIK